MIVGVPKEIKTREYRVGIVPSGVRSLKNHGHKVLVETGAGVGSGISDAEMVAAGAEIADTAADVWGRSDMVMKVKEPIAEEYKYFKDNLILYTYLHLAPEPVLTRELLKAKVIAVAYETIELADGSLPLLRPMSEIAGRMAIQVGASSLQKEHGGKGVLLGGVPGVKRGKVSILGGGVVGLNAAKMAVGLGAEVTVLDVNLPRLNYIDDIFHGRIQTMYSDSHSVEDAVTSSDLVVGAVLITGARAPILVPEAMVAKMSEGSVIVDVAVDQGGCIETVKATTHDNPTFKKHGVVHYCVANMPGAVSRTSTFALTNTTIPYALKLADKGAEAACRDDAALLKGVNCFKGRISHEAVARSLGLAFEPLKI
ncbi:MAG: alanine dehydrogenase [Myxococcota bacterium]|jgi:alanine dehydrogenase